ncbi:MinD/ParA family protein, partial [bacterium]|nr:MinD/ParA family protein [bacterium]
GIFLSNMGYKTYIIDLDLGSANLHTTLGAGVPQVGLQNYITNQVTDFKDIAVETPFPNLKLISGNNDALDMANINSAQKSKIMSGIHNLEADYIILDLSAGTHETTLDFFLMAHKHLLVTTPEPSSIENVYRFMKASFFRYLKRYEYQFNLREVVNELMTNKVELNIKSPSDLLKLIKVKDPENGKRLCEQIERFEFQIILNQTRTFKDVELGESIKLVSSKYFSMNTHFLGHVDHDNAVWQSLRKRRHLIVEYPHSRLYSQLMKITRELVREDLKRVATK